MAEQAQETHTRELARQREHEQMLAQIARTDRAVDDCCRPIRAALGTLAIVRYNWVGGTVTEMEVAAPQVVEQMLGHSKEICNIVVNAEGQAVSLQNGEILWNGTTGRDGLTHVFDHNNHAFDSAAGFVVALADFIVSRSQPYCSELPAGILDCLATEPTIALADRFRLYVRRCLLPVLQNVSKILDMHRAVVRAHKKTMNAFLVVSPLKRNFG
eukprot:SAG31_NODE_5247_length_2652_cov_2.071680_2_plen_214_part_00